MGLSNPSQITSLFGEQNKTFTCFKHQEMLHYKLLCRSDFAFHFSTFCCLCATLVSIHFLSSLCRVKSKMCLSEQIFWSTHSKKHEKWWVAEWETRLLWTKQRQIILSIYFNIQLAADNKVFSKTLCTLVRCGLTLGQFLALPLKYQAVCRQHTYGYELTLLPVY